MYMYVSIEVLLVYKLEGARTSTEYIWNKKSIKRVYGKTIWGQGYLTVKNEKQSMFERHV